MRPQEKEKVECFIEVSLGAALNSEWENNSCIIARYNTLLQLTSVSQNVGVVHYTSTTNYSSARMLGFLCPFGLATLLLVHYVAIHNFCQLIGSSSSPFASMCALVFWLCWLVLAFYYFLSPVQYLGLL
jgi:hypothetical protein